MPSRLTSRIGFLVYLVGYLALVAWFKWVDVYHANFATTGLTVVIYNLARTLFVFYLFWILTGAGALVLRRALRDREEIAAPGRLALYFFAGAGAWQIALLALGYLNLYSVPVAVVATLPFLILSWNNVHSAARALRQQLRSSDRSTLAGMGAVGVTALLLLVVKGLYPGGANDYFTHYFPYYRTVVEHGGIWPNEVWYHYYYSKGAGLFFLGMLLTDPLAPQLVTYCFMLAAALVVYLMVRASASNPSWAWAAVVIFLAVYINTPIWGQFEKQHEINAAFVIALAWMSAAALAPSGPIPNKAWIIGTALAIVGAVIMNTSTGYFLVATFAVLAAWYLLRRRYVSAFLCVGLAGVAGATLTIIFLINYVTTGLMDDQTILTLWPFVDLAKLQQIGTLAVVLKLHWGKVGMASVEMPLLDAAKYFIASMRLYIFLPLIAVGSLVAVRSVLIRIREGAWRARLNAPSQAAVISAMALVTLALALTVAQAQPISFFRYSSFVVPLSIAGGILLWSLPIDGEASLLGRIVRDRRAPIVMVLIALTLTTAVASRRASFFRSVLPNAWHFATGAYSIDTAYTLQQDWPNNPWGAIYPGARGAYAVVGPKTPIWSMNILAYCMLPDCQVETPESFSLGTGTAEVLFGSPEAGRAALQASSHNYFLFSRELPLDDYLPRSPLFAPDNIAKYLGVRWTDGTTTLLTWLGPDSRPLDEDWVAAYRQAVEQSGAATSYPYDQIKSVFARLHAMPPPWRPFKLPWAP